MNAPLWNKPLPIPTPASQPFWDGLKAHQVRLQRCADCAHWIFYPRLQCSHCASPNLEWQTVAGTGTLYTYTVARVPTLPEFADEMPQMLAVIALDQGPHINTTIVGVAPESLKVGQRMRPVFDERPGSAVLLRYTPVEAAQAGVITGAEPAEAEPEVETESAQRQVSCRDLDAMRSLISAEWSGWSNSFRVSQDIIDQFAALSGDDYWIHTDPVRAKAQSPFGGTIAHGFFTLALASRLLRDAVGAIDGARMGINYGLNKVRFPAPLPVGSRVRGRCTLQRVDAVDGGVQATWSVLVERDGSVKPCCAAEWLVRYYL